MHCIVLRDINDPEKHSVYDHRESQTITMGVERLKRADALIGHNIIEYDIPLIKETHEFDFQGEVLDTLVCSHMFYPHLDDRDYERRPADMPQRMYGSHGLEAWGYRLKCFKGSYGKQSNAWHTYTPEMLDYCVQDTLVTVKLAQLMQRRINELT